MTNFSFSYSKVTRVFYSYGKSVPECAVITIDDGGLHTSPFFDREKLEEETETYFLRNLGEGGYSYSLAYEGGDKPQKATLAFQSKINSLFTFSKKETFVIRKGNKYVE